MINDNDFSITYGWMKTKLGLKGNELALYSLIYGYTKDGVNYYCNSQSYMAEWLGITRSNTNIVLKKLVEKGYIEKVLVEQKGTKKVYKYRAIKPIAETEHVPIAKTEHVPLLKQNRHVAETEHVPITETEHNKDIYNNNISNSSSSNSNSNNNNSTAATTNDINLLNVFEKLGFGTINYRIVTDLSILEKEFTSQWVKEAMEESVTSGVRNLKYVRSILQRWKAQGKPKDTSILSKENKKPVENRYGEAPKYEPVTDEYIEKIKEKSLKKLREQAKGQQQENTSKPKNLDELLKKIKL